MIYDALTELIETEELQPLAVDVDNCLAKVQDARVRAKKKMKKVVAPAPSSAASSTIEAHVNLPELHLPKFKGDILEFPRFWDLFTNTVEKDPKLSAVHKFTYLSGYLTGEAAEVIKELRVTEQNYEQAKKLLKERYDRPNALIFRHIHSLLHIQVDKCKHKDSLSQLRALMDQSNIHIRSLESLGIKGADYGVILVPLILSRLPQEIVGHWSRNSEDKERDLTHLLDLCNKEIQVREKTQSVRISSIEQSAERPTAHLDRERRKPQPSRSTATALTTTTGNKCIFCHRDGHDGTVCRTVRKFSWE